MYSIEQSSWLKVILKIGLYITTCKYKSVKLSSHSPPVLDDMKPSTAVVLLRRCQWREYTCVITPLDGSVGVKYGRKDVL